MALRRRGGGQLDVVDLRGGLVDAVDGRLHGGGVAALALQHDAERLAAGALEARDRLVDLRRAASPAPRSRRP